MDQSYFRFLFQLARKSKQSGLSKSEKSLAERNVTFIFFTRFLKEESEISIQKDFGSGVPGKGLFADSVN